MDKSIFLLSSLIILLSVVSVATACDCMNWLDMGCFNETNRQYYRTCDPSDCDVTTYTSADSSCTPPQEVSIFLNKYIIAIGLILGISAGIGLAVGGESILITFVSCAGILTFVFSAIGLFPQWIIWVTLAGASLLFAKMIIDFING